MSVQSHGGIAWYLACLLPPSAMSLFAFSLISWETASEGINWHTVHMSVTPSFYFSSGSIIAMLLLDAALFWMLMLLVDRVAQEGSFFTAAAAFCRRWFRSFVSPGACLVFYCVFVDVMKGPSLGRTGDSPSDVNRISL